MIIYEIKNSPASITALSSGNLLRKKITFFSMRTTDGVSVPYAAFFVIEESTDKSVYTVKYTGSSTETKHEYSPSSGIAAVRVSIYDVLSGLPLVNKVVFVDKQNVSGYKYTVTGMPENPDIGDVVLWSGAAGTYTNGRLYEWDGVGWNQLDYINNMSVYADALTDILASNTLSTGYFDAVFCNAFFSNSASISALQTKVITLSAGGELRSADYIADTSGIRVGYDGDADFNNNLHIGGNTTIDGNTTIGAALLVTGAVGFNGITHIGGTLTVDGATQLGGMLDIIGNTTVMGTTVMNGDTTIEGNATMTGTVNATSGRFSAGIGQIFTMSTTGNYSPKGTTGILIASDFVWHGTSPNTYKVFNNSYYCFYCKDESIGTRSVHITTLDTARFTGTVDGDPPSITIYSPNYTLINDVILS